MTGVEEDPLNVVAIIQARMGSRRFPGKVLADLCGRPVLEWVVDAVKRVEGVHQIVVATTTNAEDEAIEEWCEKHEVHCFRGEPLDVLKRYADCAREYRATHVLRITADCPMLHSDTVSTVLRSGLEAKSDYFGLAGEFPDGFDCEGFSVDALNRANVEAVLASDREHVTPYMKRNPLHFSSRFLDLWSGFGDVRLTIDQPEDLVFLNAVVVATRVNSSLEVAHHMLSFLRERVDLLEINSHIVRNEGYGLSVALDRTTNERAFRERKGQ